MSYVVTARRWRPQTFEDLVGQEHVSRTLTNAIESGRVGHAFLLTGVRGVGKTTAARILAKALNCERGPTPKPCNECTNCREITSGSAVDVLEIDGASNTGVDDVREIIENVRYRPAKSRFKIYIIDEVHMLSNSAFNALLKTLEEPPSHVKFIFATTDVHKLPATVQSRCQRYDFRRIPLALVAERLRKIVAAEGGSISERALFAIAREGEGSMRDAQSLLDQVLAYGGGNLDDADVLATLGVADRQLVYDLAEALVRCDAARALELANRVHAQGFDIRRLTRDLVEHFRNLAVARATDGALLPDLPDEEQRLVREQAARIPVEHCDRCFRVLLDTDEEVGRSPYPKLVVEMALIKLAGTAPLVAVEELIGRLDDLEKRLRGTPGTGPVPTGGARPVTARASGGGSAPPPAQPKPAGPAVGKGGAEAPAHGGAGASWSDFVAFVGRTRSALAHHLGLCTMSALEGGILTVEAPRGFYYDYLARRDHLEELEQFAGAFFGREVRANLVAQSAPESGASAVVGRKKAVAELRETALQDPAVRAAVQILGGEVQEVKARRPQGRREVE